MKLFRRRQLQYVIGSFNVSQRLLEAMRSDVVLADLKELPDEIFFNEVNAAQDEICAGIARLQRLLERSQ